MEASYVLVDGEERWVLDELLAELSEQAYMCQREQGVDGEDDRRQGWLCSGWSPGAAEEQLGIVDWMGEPGEQNSKGDEEDFAEGVEQQLMVEGHGSMRSDQKWLSRLAQAVEDGDWGVLDVYSDGGLEV